MARAGGEPGEPTRTHAGERDKGLGESTLDEAAGRNAPAGAATGPGSDRGCKREPAGGSGVATRRVPTCQQGPRGGPLCLRGGGLGRPHSEGASLGQELPSRSPEACPVGQAGPRTCRRGARVRTAICAPQPPLPLSALGPAAGFQRVPPPAASAEARPQTQTGGPTPLCSEGAGGEATAASGPAPQCEHRRHHRPRPEPRGRAGSRFT